MCVEETELSCSSRNSHPVSEMARNTSRSSILDTAYIQEDECFAHTVHADMDALIADIRERYKKDAIAGDN